MVCGNGVFLLFMETSGQTVESNWRKKSLRKTYMSLPLKKQKKSLTKLY